MTEILFISTAARILGMHPQTLRKYDRLGLVQPSRTIGSMRLYTAEEIERLRRIKRLVDDTGVNLAGVQQLMGIAEVVERIRPLAAGDALEHQEGRQRLHRELDRLAELRINAYTCTDAYIRSNRYISMR